MKNFEGYLKLKEVLSQAQADVPRLKEELLRREQNQPALEGAAEKAEAFFSLGTSEERGWKETVEKAKENKKIIFKLRDQIEKTEKRAKVIEGELKGLEWAALSDIRKHYRPVFEELVKALYLKLEEAKELELKIMKIKEEARTKGHKISYIPYSLTPPIEQLLIKDGDREEYWPISRLIKDCEQAGIILNGR